MVTRFPVILMSIWWLTGCSSTKMTLGPDGTPHEMISCSTMEKCYRKAHSVCGGRYKIIDKKGDNSSGYELLIKCG